MFKQTAGAILLLIVLSLFFVQPLRAGGWTVVTLDELPLAVRAGQPTSIRFQVLQHGVHPLVLASGEMTVVAHHPAGGERLTLTAQPAGEEGYYRVELLLPRDGRWSWEIRPGGFPPAQMPDLMVIADPLQPAVQSQPPPSQWSWWQQVTYQLLISLRAPPASAPAPAEVGGSTDQAAYGKALSSWGFPPSACLTFVCCYSLKAGLHWQPPKVISNVYPLQQAAG